MVTIFGNFYRCSVKNGIFLQKNNIMINLGIKLAAFLFLKVSNFQNYNIGPWPGLMPPCQGKMGHLYLFNMADRVTR
jgi:hypothetical protein